ncbi:broad-complex core protein isoforms 1/2/3/4/5 [Malaya genurostris]|uniref:broad-complex core protein isoforms 1/2/3/4/5 n=1 Tax=Malaya genurostris TaxID=325434 RepID=UPI0026F3C647|nr:broad-complex core protein isoforms 1/2/3/4/5 [Malaya genurostris]
MGSSDAQTYCLRWNNHKSNLVEILDALSKMECYVDCTIYVDEQVQFKAHRVVLAANSPYFQSILQDVPMDHCSILFPGVQEFEMRAILEYMYTGEVNVTQAQIEPIMEIAKQLEVKGLFDMDDIHGRFKKMVIERERDSVYPSNNNYSTKPQPPNNNEQSPPVISTSTNISIAQSSSSPPYTYKSPYTSLYSRTSPTAIERDRSRERHHEEHEHGERSASFVHSPSHPTYSHHNESPLDEQRQTPSASSSSSQPTSQNLRWSLPGQIPVTLHQPQLHNMLSSVYDSSADMNPLKRKKLQSMSTMLRDTPILRNVLAQSNPADSSQSTSSPLSLHPIPGLKSETSATSAATGHHHASNPSSTHHSNGGGYKHIKEPLSPYADKSYDDEALMESRLNYSADDARLASYVPHQQQKPEWKRYKQYTRTDIHNAIECVRNGMSALQAARRYGVPSRTLYDKVKKMGITTGRPMNRAIKRSPSSGGSPAPFPYGLSGASHMFGTGHPGEQQMQSQSQHQLGDEDKPRMIKMEHSGHHLPPTIPHPAAALLDPSFLQQAAGREALHAMAIAAAAHAAVNGINTSPGNHGTRSPSPNVLMKYMRSVSMGSPDDRDLRRESSEGDRHHRSNGSETYDRLERDSMEHEDHRDISGECDDIVEDLSMTRRGPDSDRESISPQPMPSHQHLHLPLPPQIPPQQPGVIVPAPSKIKEDYNPIPIKREIPADSNAPME